jgi:hypothetical protein
MNLYAVRYCEIRAVIYTLSILFGSECWKEFSYSSLAVLRYLMGYFISKKEMGNENLACPPVFC